MGDTPPLPYYLYCLIGIAIMATGVLYWAAWRIVPKWFGYEFVPRKEKLEDGTVVTLVRPPLVLFLCEGDELIVCVCSSRAAKSSKWPSCLVMRSLARSRLLRSRYDLATI